VALSSYDIRFILSVSDRTGNSLRRVAGDMGRMTGDAQRMRKAFTALDVGRGLQLRGLLGGAALGVAAQQAANFSTSITKAATQIKGNNSVTQIGKNTIELQKQILDLMGQFPASAQEQANAAYDIFSAMNVPLKQGVGLLKLFNMVAVAGATDLDTATNAMITVVNNFGGSWDDIMKSINTSFAIIRFGRLEFSELNDMFNAVIPSAKATGQSLEDVGGAMALITKLIPSQKQGATAIARLLEVLARPDFIAGAQKMGLSITDATGALKPLPKVINELARLPIAQAQSTINSLFQVVTATGRGAGNRGIQSTVQARRALIFLVKNQKEYMTVQKGVTGATNEFEKRFTLMIGSSGVRWEKFKAQIQALLIVIGTYAIPIFDKLGQKISKGIDWAKNNKGLIEFAVKATAAIAIGSLLAGTFLKLYGTGLILYTGLRRLAMFVGFQALAADIRLVAASFLLLKAQGLAALPAVLANVRALSALAKFGIITTTVIVLWEVHKTKGWNDFWKNVDDKILGVTDFVQKHGGPLGAGAVSGVDALIELDRKVRIKNLKELQARGKGKGQGSNNDISKQYQTNYKSLIASIKKDIKSTGSQIFNTKMLKELGLDPSTMNKQINDFLNQSRGGQTNEAQNTAKQIADSTKDILKTASDALVSQYQQFRDTNKQAFGDFFAPPDANESEEQQLRKAWNWDKTGNSIIQNLQKRIRDFRKWRNSIAELARRGAPAAMIKDLKEQGPAIQDQLDQMLKMKSPQFKNLVGLWRTANRMITRATDVDFKQQLNKWNSYGKSTALNIITGAESEEQNIQNRMTGLVNRLYASTARAIATQQTKLEMSVPNEITLNWGLLPKGTGTRTPKPAQIDPTIRRAGLAGRYAIPRAGTEGLTPQAAAAMGARYQAMARFYNQGRKGELPPNIVVIQVDGTFLTPEEQMNMAANMAGRKLKNRR
jgi:phage tail tape measure protein, TP901 family, core region